MKYNAIQTLGLKSFRSSPTLSINNPKVETNLSANCFAAGYFEAAAGEVEGKVNESLVIELWHSDRLKKDILLGKARLELKQVLTVPLRKKQDSFARVLDAYIPVDEVNEDDDPVKKIGAIRVLVYL